MNDPALAWLVVLPLAWATAAFLMGPGRGAWLSAAGSAVQLFLAYELAQQVMGGSLRVHNVGGWGAPLGIDLVADGLAAVMLLLIQGVALPLLLYARAYFAKDAQGSRYFWPCAGYLLAAMNALILSADVFNVYVTLELLGLAAVGLVAAGGVAGAIRAALRYLFASLLGSGAYLLGVALFYGTYGNVSLSVLSPMVTQEAPAAVIFAAGLMLAGLMLKTALLPFHFWLPPAHAQAPTPVSALLSALVVKATFYLIVRLWTTLFAPLATPAAALLLGLFGAAAILWGSVVALRQRRLKMLIAYSTVAQIGYLFLLFPLATQTTPEAAQSAMQGTLMQVLAHGLAKAAMFTAAGALTLSTGHDEIERLGGIAVHLPLTVFAFALAGVTLMGLPPSAGFLAKWLLFDSAIAARQWAWVAVLIAGGLLTAAYVFKVLRHAFVRTEQSTTFQPISPLLEWPAFLLAVASLALGLRASEVLTLLGTP
jgi:formate hydrogenlyase subunit 3/multisubunit Na+/H+ antiporter MnhD subunit